MGQSRTHKSRYKGGKKVGGGLRNPGGGKSSKGKQWGRYSKHENGCVPQKRLIPEQRLEYLDEHNFVASKEREKCARRIKIRRDRNQPKNKKKDQYND